MDEPKHEDLRTETGAVLRWILICPMFAVLVILSANFTLGFFKWLLTLSGPLFYVMSVAAVLVVLSNALAPVIACMVAPRKRPATVLLGIGHFLGMIYGYTQFEWATLPTFVWSAHAIMVYLGLAAVYYLDRLYWREMRRAAAAAQSAPT